MKAKELTRKIFENIKSNWFMPITENQVYSTAETKIGVWTDGKPLYRKTIDCGALPNTTLKQVNIGIDNIDVITRLYGIAFNATNSYLTLPDPGDPQNPSIVRIAANNDAIRITTNIDRSSFTKTYVTIEYTKTTDTATTSKVPFEPLHEYSTDEKLVGYWIDGKPVYERTVSINVGTLTKDVQKDVVTPISNLDTIVKMDGAIQYNLSGSIGYIPLQITDSLSNSLYWMYTYESTLYVSVKTSDPNAYSNATVIITVRYTKTTD